MASDPTPAAPRRSHPVRRAFAWVGIAILAVVTSLIAWLAVPGFAPARAPVLAMGLRSLDDGLPGTITCVDARWPRAGRIELEGLVWILDRDTLAEVSTLAIDIELASFLRRDLALREVSAHIAQLDLVAIRAACPDGSCWSRGRSPLRDGVLPGVPSLAVRTLRVSAERVRVDTASVRRGPASSQDRFALDASLRLLHGEPLRVEVNRLSLDHPSDSLRVADARLIVDLSGPGRIEAAGHGQLGARWPFTLDGSTTRDGRFELHLARATGSDGLRARGRFERDGWKARGVDVEHFTAKLRDVEAEGAWRYRDARHAGRVHVAMTGTRWLSELVTIPDLPETLQLKLDATAEGLANDLHVRLRARGSARVRGVAVEHSELAAEGSTRAPLRLRFALAARALDVDASGAGEWRQTDAGWEMRLAPVRLDAAGAANPVRRPGVPSADARLGAPVVRFDTAGDAMGVRDLRFTGGFGEGRASAQLRRGAGPFALTVSWPRAPEALIARAHVTDARARALRGAWRDSTRYAARIQGRVAATEPRLVADATFELPGPAALAALLPAGARVGDLGPVQGRGRFESTASGWKAEADLGLTPWIDRFQVAARMTGGAIAVDQLDAALPGLTASIRTRVQGGAVDGSVEARVRDATFLARFVPALDSVQLRAAVQGRIAGAAGAPDVDVAFLVAAATPNLVVPRGSGRAYVRAGRLTRLDAVAPRGAWLGAFLLDSLRVHYRDESRVAGAGLPGRFTVVAGGRDVAWAQAGRVRTAPAMAIATDSLRVALYDRDLVAGQPFDLALVDGGFALDGLRLAGSMGTIAADGRVTRETSTLALAASLELPELPPTFGVPRGLVPAKLDVRLQPERGDSLELTVEARGLQIASRKDVVAHARLLGRSGQIVARVDLRDGDATMLELTARLPGRLAVLAPLGPGADGPLDVDVRATRFPLPSSLADPVHAPGYLDRAGTGRAPVLDGELRLRGTGRYPEGGLTGAITFPGWKQLKGDRLTIEARLVPAGEGLAARPPRGSVVLAAAATPGVTARVAGIHDGRSVLDADLSLPIRVSLAPPAADPITGRAMSLVLDAPQFPLEMLEPFTPALRRLEGTMALHVTARGAPFDPSFEARARFARLDASTPERSRIVASGDVTANGTLARPVVRGRIQVDHGVIVLPEQQKLLHATQGQALLWQRQGVVLAEPPDEIRAATPAVDAKHASGPVPADSGTGSAARDARAQALAAHRAADSLRAGSDLLRTVDLDVRVVAPGGTRVRGRGLDVDLGGDVELIQKDGVPTLLGDLETQGGGMDLYGRRMNVERGTLTFFGGRKLNPTLDVTLARRTNDVDITAHVTGTAANPRVEVESEPPMDQAEILSYLLFDRPLDDLDASQNTRVEDRAAQQAESYLAARLTGRLSESLGLDLLSYERSQRDSTGESSRSVTLGKYLTPQMLVKVEQGFDNLRGFDVVLEYWIRRGLRLSTHAQQSRSGVALDWTRDY